MIRPQPRAAIDGPNACPSRNADVRLTSIDKSQPAAVSDPSGGRRLIPAQLTRMSGGPNGSAAATQTRATSARDERSALTHSPSSSAAAVASREGSRAMRTTRAPALASAEAIAAPMPELPPVTTATRPSSENSELR